MTKNNKSTNKGSRKNVKYRPSMEIIKLDSKWEYLQYLHYVLLLIFQHVSINMGLFVVPVASLLLLLLPVQLADHIE